MAAHALRTFRGRTPRERLRHQFRLVTGREPRPAELGVLEAALARSLADFTRDPAAAGQLLSNVPLLVFSDAFTTEPVGSFTASINWGDGTPADSFTPAQWAAAAGSFTHTYADGGTGGTATTRAAASRAACSRCSTTRTATSRSS